MKKFKRIVSVMLGFAMLFSLIPVSATEEKPETITYTEVELGGTISVTGGSATATNMVPVKRAGREGLMSVSNINARYVMVDIDDKVLFDIPDETPIDITVEYFDSGNGWFGLTYDSHNPSMGWGGIWDEILQSSNDYVYMTNSQEWKSYTFHLENMRAASRINGSDFRLALWTKENGTSTDEIIFGSVKVEQGKLLTPLDAELDVNGVGGIASAEDELSFGLKLRNKSNESISGKITSKVYDSLDRCIQEVVTDFAFELEAYEKKSEAIPIQNPKIHGLYRVESAIEVWYTESPDDVIADNVISRFSISYVFEKDEGNMEFGTHHELSEPYGSLEEMAEVMKKGGITVYRDDGLKSSLIDGKYVVSDYNKNIFQVCKDNGVEVIQILYGEPGRTWNVFPETDAEIEVWAKYVGDVAADLKGLVNYFEFYNEPNLSGFNAKKTSPEIYAKICKRGYEEIKKVNPDAKILGIGSAAYDGLSIDYKWTKRAFDAGAYDYLDIISIHPYDWSGMFRDELWMYSANVLRELMSQYGEDKPIWITEFGFSTYIGRTGYTRKESAVNHILARALAKTYGLYDRYVMFSLADRTDRTEFEHNWGLINYWEEPEPTPYSAKESYVAMTAFNHFINHNTELKGKIDDNRESMYKFEIDPAEDDATVEQRVFDYSFTTETRVYAMNFYNNKLGKNVLFMQTGAGEAKKSIRLGCKSIELYDMYGNKRADIVSPDGVFSFAIGREPVYAVGSFTDFAEVEYKPVIDPVDNLTVDAVSGDTMTLKFKSRLNKALEISVEDYIEVVENKGFKNGEAVLKIKVAATDEDEQCFFVTIRDKAGNVYYCEEYVFKITPPVEVDISAEPANSIGNNYYRVRATIKNLGNATALNGTFAITGPENVAKINTSRTFKNLAPGKTVTFLFPLPEKVNKNVVALNADLALTNGYTASYTENINFTTISYAKTKPVIDGAMSDGEWTGSWIGADEVKDVREIDNWEGAEDVSFNGTMMWDEDNFYFVGIGVDDVHFAQYEGGASNMWMADSFQFAFDDRETINPVEDATFTELGIGAVPNAGDTVYRFKSLYNEPAMVLEKAEVVIKRYSNYTLYECRIPWDEIFYEGYELRPDEPFRISVLLNDNDADSRGWIEYMSGVGLTKSASMFGDVKFTK